MLAHHAVDELDRGLLFEAETVADAVAGVDEQAEAQGKIGFGGEFLDGLRLLALNHLKIVFAQIGDETALLVGNGEEHVDAGDVENDAVGVGRNGGWFFSGGLSQQSGRA